MSYKIEAFKEELPLIQNHSLREFAETAIETLPDYFFKVPASSTGKYHPSYALGEGGLLRHTKAAVRIAVELFRLESLAYKDHEKDLIVIALMLHDGYKSGVIEEKYTKTEHPTICKNQILSNEELKTAIDEQSLNLIAEAIESHMGQWNYDYKSKQAILPKPKTKMQHFVHLCDYLASRKSLEFNFDIPVSRE